MLPERPPLPLGPAARRIGRCAATTVALLARGQVHQPKRHKDRRLLFADGSAARVYRETVVDRGPTRDPVVLLVEFRLRAVRGRGHALFRAESLLNTPLFVGFPGFVSKLWLAHDQHGVYRGVYEWDGAALAEDYARALWWVLALVSERSSIHYQVLPGLRRDDLLADPARANGSAPAAGREWWRLTRTEPVAG